MYQTNQYPVVYKGHLNRTPPPIPVLGASVERYQKRFSKKNEQKLMKKLQRLQKRLNRLLSKGDRGLFKRARARKIERIQKKITAIETVLGMQPFQQSVEAEAMQQQMISQSGGTSVYPILAIVGLLLLGVTATIIVSQNKKKFRKK